MKVIDPEVKLLKQKDFGYDLDNNSSIEDISKVQNSLFKGVLDHIEECSLICNNVSVKELSDIRKLDILRHGTVYLTVPVGKPDPGNNEDYMRRMQIVNFYQKVIFI